MIVLIGLSQPRDPVGHWLKPAANADVAHYVIWRGGDELRSSCRCQMDARKATSAKCGVRLCEVCFSNLRRKLRDVRQRKAR